MEWNGLAASSRPSLPSMSGLGQLGLAGGDSLVVGAVERVAGL